MDTLVLVSVHKMLILANYQVGRKNYMVTMLMMVIALFTSIVMDPHSRLAIQLVVD